MPTIDVYNLKKYSNIIRILLVIIRIEKWVEYSNIQIASPNFSEYLRARLIDDDENLLLFQLF